MVTTLLKLRYRLLANNLTASVWQLLGYVLSCLTGLWVVGLVIVGSIFIGINDPETAGIVIGLIGTVATLGWVIFPVFLGGVDTTIDSKSLLQYPLSRQQRQASLLAIGLFGAPGITTILAALAASLVWVSAAWLIPIALLCNLLGAFICVLASRAIIALMSSFGSGRKSQAVIGTTALILLILAGPILMTVSSLFSSENGVNLADLGAIIFNTSAALAWSPFGAAWAIPLELFRGNVMAALLMLAIAIATVVLLWLLWVWALKRQLSNAASSSNRTRTVASGKLSWIGKSPSGGAGASWGRSMVYWLRDPRYLRQLISVPLLVIVFLFVMGWQFEESYVLVIVPIVAFILASVPYVDVSYDGTAFSTIWQTGISGRDDRLGRMGAAATISLPIIVVIALVLLIPTGEWHLAPAILGASVGIVLIGLGVCAVSSAYMVIPVPSPDDSPFKRVSGVTFQMNLFILLVLFVEFILSLPIIALLALAFLDANELWPWLCGIVSLALGLLFFWLGVRIGGRALDKNGTKLLVRLKAYQGI